MLAIFGEGWLIIGMASHCSRKFSHMTYCDYYVLRHAYYDTNVLETTLQREFGHRVLIYLLADKNSNWVFMVRPLFESASAR